MDPKHLTKKNPITNILASQEKKRKKREKKRKEKGRRNFTKKFHFLIGRRKDVQPPSRRLRVLIGSEEDAGPRPGLSVLGCLVNIRGGRSEGIDC
jgi:hypothetical protein